MKKILFLAVCFWSAHIGLKAQEEAIYSQYLFHPILVNPAYAGFLPDHELLFNFRNTHAGFPGSPQTYTLAFNGPIAPKLGFVGLMNNDKAGDLNRFRAQAGLAYMFKMGTVKMNAGLAAQYQKFQLANGAILDSGIDPSDPLIRAAADGLNFFNTSIGVYGENDGKLLFGLSVVDLVRTRIDDIQSSSDESSFFKYYNAWVGYRWNIANYNFTVEPSVMIKRLRNVPFQTDFNVRLSFLDEQLFGGLTYTAGGFSKTSFLLGTRINTFRLFYSYDVALEDFQKYNNGSHELSLSFRIASVVGKNNQ